MLLSGCGKTAGNVNSDTADSSEVTEQSGSEESAASQSDTDDIDSMFTDRDKEVGYDEEKCVAITLSDDGSSCDNTSVAIDGQTITITEEGTYLLSGSLSNGSVVVATDENVKVRLIFNGVVINNDSSAAIYVQSADKVFITLASDSENMLSNGGTYEAVDDNNIDSVMFSKSDLTLNGSGSLTVTAKAGHGIVSKDDLVITGGTYAITAASQGLSGKDSIRILDGDFTIASGKDALHSENEDNAEKGFVYIAGGNYNLTASGDGISASGNMTLLDGMYTMTTGGGSENGKDHQEGGPGGQGGPGGGMDNPGEDLMTSGERPMESRGEMPDNGQMMEQPDRSDEETTGGILVAAGSSGMAVNFGDNSTQGSILVNLDRQEAGTDIVLTDASGTELINWQPTKQYTSVVISCPGIAQGESYTLKAGTSETTVTMDSLIYGTGNTMGR